MDANLYFLFAKITNMLLSPVTVFMTAIALGFLLVLSPWARSGKWLMGLALVGYLATSVFPGGYILVNVLENRFPQPQLADKPVDGVIVLGGSFSTTLSNLRGQVSLGGNAERLTEFVRLARAYPDAKLVFTGGIGLLSGKGPTEAAIARQFFEDIGLNVARIQFEDQSRNTTESAAYTLDMLNPQGQRWLLITSARHMPRAMGLFRKAGWADLVAYPVDYLTSPDVDVAEQIAWPGNIGHINQAIYEGGGLFVAWLRGSIDEPFPKP